MTDFVSLLFIAMILIDFKITKFSLNLLVVSHSIRKCVKKEFLFNPLATKAIIVALVLKNEIAYYEITHS